MANDGANQPSGLLDPPPRTNQKVAPKRRRYRRCKSLPLAAFIPADTYTNRLLPRSKSVFYKLHPSFRKVAMFLVIYLGVGTICFYLFRHQIKGKKTNGILDTLYFCIVTMTTIGYGDLVPNSVHTKLLACAFVFLGMALVGLMLIKAADYLVEKQEILLVKALNMRRIVGPIEILKETETNRVRYKCLIILTILLVLIIVGTIVLVTIEKMDVVDAFYCVCCTVTTLGYGDQSFSTKAGRVFAMFWMLTSSLCLAQFFLYVAEMNTERRRRALVEWVLTRRMTNFDLEAADLDEDGLVQPAEFIIYKLKEMGKISQEDISLVMAEFEYLDVDQSGTLTPSDIMLAQL